MRLESLESIWFIYRYDLMQKHRHLYTLFRNFRICSLSKVQTYSVHRPANVKSVDIEVSQMFKKKITRVIISFRVKPNVERTTSFVFSLRFQVRDAGFAGSTLIRKWSTRTVSLGKVETNTPKMLKPWFW